MRRPGEVLFACVNMLRPKSEYSPQLMSSGGKLWIPIAMHTDTLHGNMDTPEIR
jgi:hypothetical protein